MAVDLDLLFVCAARPADKMAVEVIRAAAIISTRFFAGGDDGRG